MPDQSLRGINRRLSRSLGLVLVLVALLLNGGPARADRATLTIDAARPGVKISPVLYGIFFEEINHAGDGGIYAELIRNRSFEDKTDAPEGWSLRSLSDGAEGNIALDDSLPLNDKNRRSLRVEAKRGSVGATNGGYWGIAVKKGDTYRLSLHARRSPELAGGLRVALETANGRRLAEARLPKPTPDWKRYEVTLKAGDTDPAARLVIGMDAPGTVWLDMVSLFPQKTWKGRANGLRADLMELVAGMKPAFVRFPGGCFVEGDRLENAFRWKETIGPIEERPGHWNLWGYRSTDGLGYHEYLQMSEDLGAEAMFVVNCGMSHNGIVPMDQLDPWVQDALDALEYARGPVTSKWGALRAKNGHPKPFRLTYLEIGNENGGPAYNERYARFYDAIRAKYPDVKIIANVWGGVPTSRPTPILDEHYYSNPQFFASQTRRYDTYDRKGPEIYVGEYAVTQGAGQGNLIAALGEAAFMTGMERNGDIVTMSSYAPLFVNVNQRTWNPDAIVFDSARSFGTPSYHVQAMFGQNRGDVVLPAAIKSEAPPAPPARGGIGLSTWRTQAEYRDVKFEAADGKTLVASDFSRGAEGWRVVRGEWQVQEGAYRQSAAGEDMRAVAGDPNQTGDGVLTLKARKMGGAEGFLIMFRVQNSNNWLWWNIGGWNNTQHGIEKSTGGQKSLVGSHVPGSVETGRWYDIRIEMNGERIRCYLDGKLIHDARDMAPEPLSAVAGREEKSGDIIVKVVNMSERAQETQVSLNGAGRVSRDGTAIVLTSGGPQDENSFGTPKKIAPVTQRLTNIGPTFTHTFPPHSVTVLRLKAQQRSAAR